MESSITLLDAAARDDVWTYAEILYNDEIAADINYKGEDGLAAIHLAVTNNNENLLRMIIEAKCDINITLEDGSSSLHMTAKQGKPKLTKMLIDAGADINIIDNDGSTSLYMAAIHEQVEVVKELLDAGADIQIADKNGATALHMVSENTGTEIAKLLLEKGADFDWVNHYGWTPTHDAVQGGNVSIVRLLIQAGAQVDLHDMDGWTPLYLASQNGQLEMVQLLLHEATVDINATDKEGISPLSVATSYNHIEVIKFLLQFGADPTIKNKNGKGPMELVVSDEAKFVLEQFEKQGIPVSTEKPTTEEKTEKENHSFNEYIRILHDQNPENGKKEKITSSPSLQNQKQNEEKQEWTPIESINDAYHDHEDSKIDFQTEEKDLLSLRRYWQEQNKNKSNSESKVTYWQDRMKVDVVDARDLINKMWEKEMYPRLVFLEKLITSNAVQFDTQMALLCKKMKILEDKNSTSSVREDKNGKEVVEEVEEEVKEVVQQETRSDMISEIHILLTSLLLFCILQSIMQYPGSFSFLF